MRLTPDEIAVEIVPDGQLTGMRVPARRWWITVTHIPSMSQIRIYSERQHKDRATALTLMELLLDSIEDKTCTNPENLK